MKNILEELYYGRVHPIGETMPRSKEYMETRHKGYAKEKEFKEKLEKVDPNLRKEYDELNDLENDADCFEYSQTFMVGFRLGARIVTAVFTGK